MRKYFYQALNLIFQKGFKRNISGFKLRLPVGFHNYFENNYELNNINFLNNNLRNGDFVIDVGAHIGLISIFSAIKVGSSGKVFSFEPTPLTFKLLKKTIEINNLGERIFPQKIAISNKKGTTSFFITKTAAHNSNSLANNQRGGEIEVEVLLTTIDAFCLKNSLKRVDLIKIDAEGAEYSVLEGAKSVVNRFKPRIILALHPSSIKNYGNSLESIWDLIKSYGYKVVWKNEEVQKDKFLEQEDLFDVFLI